jgi:hypothetical protein
MAMTHQRHSTDLHVIPGRIRVRSPLMRRDFERARRAEIDLAALPGITLARVNPATGSILLHFEPAQWTPGALLSLLSHRGYVEAGAGRRASSTAFRSDRELLHQCITLIGKELVCAAITRAFPHPVLSMVLAVL